MTLSVTRTAVRRTLNVVVLGAFLVGLAGEAFGPHPKRLDARYGTGPAGDTAHESRRSGPTTAAVAPSGDDESRHDHPEHEPCTCVGTCHGAAASPVPAQAPSLQVAGARPLRAAARTTGRLVYGRSSYVLPYPNPPPLREFAHG